MNIGKLEKMEEHTLSDEQLLKAKEDIELLVKLICYVGKEHPDVDAIANRIYDKWAGKK